LASNWCGKEKKIEAAGAAKKLAQTQRKTLPSAARAFLLPNFLLFSKGGACCLIKNIKTVNFACTYFLWFLR